MNTNTTAKGTVLAGDCRTLLEAIPPESISLALTDPPYFLHGMDSNWNHEELNYKTAKSTGAVKGLPAGMKFDPEQGKRLQEFLLPICQQILRTCEPGAAMLCFSAPRLAHRTAAAMEDAGFIIADLLAWHRPGQPRAVPAAHFISRRKDLSEQRRAELLEKAGQLTTPQLTPQHEVIVWGIKQGTWPYCQEPVPEISQMLDFARDKRKFGHVTVKPVALLREIISAFAGPEGTTVLDPFAGTGSTGVAALMEGRNFVGMELDPEMAEKAQHRVDTEPQESQQGNLL